MIENYTPSRARINLQLDEIRASFPCPDPAGYRILLGDIDGKPIANLALWKLGDPFRRPIAAFQSEGFLLSLSAG
jgi:hypothetical protein